ncbi:MAG: glycosyltransferase family 1 protein [Propionibacteriaceae bacterium]|jgi:phosphatidylinositol alpha 1,6-mannosyltransferase|nr:glycosyltransferase family 1 protein [Propionibacteriaceae bacterium]
MRVAIVAESFLPQVNGVTNSVVKVAEYLQSMGHEGIIIAPSDELVPPSFAGFPVVQIPAIALPMYHEVRVGLTPTFVLDRILKEFLPDVVHVASPFMIGSTALISAAHLSIPTVAIYQTDVPSFAKRYGLGLMEPVAWTRVRQIHELATLTLAPSSWARDQLVEHEIPRVKIWGRGVDTIQFNPRNRDENLHKCWAPDSEILIGYMGRLAPEKQVHDLTALTSILGTRLVIIGTGPQKQTLEALLPQAQFTDKLTGTDLARALATLDIFVHPGELETFCQAIQEALASGVPVVAPAKGGPIDLVNSGEWGFLYPPGDVATMRTQIEELVKNPSLRRRFSLAARGFTEQRSWSTICAQLVEFYEEAVSMTAGTIVDMR